MQNSAPYILEETGGFAVIFKPPKMHSVPVGNKNNDTQLEWFASQSPVFDLVHRLDFETHGLVLAARNEKIFQFFKVLQANGDFVKEYSAICVHTNTPVNPSAPIPNYTTFPPPPALSGLNPSKEKPLIIDSFFRPFGPGRKQVRPVIDDRKKQKEIAKDRGGCYRTEITGINGNVFTARIKRGFRHQIRCHLAWAGFPILNDELYGLNPAAGELALRAHALFFTDPSGKRREYRVEAIKEFFL